MTSGSTRIYPLSEQQERRLLDYLDGKYLEVRQEYSRRHEPVSKLPTLRAYLGAMRNLLTLTLQVPPAAPSGILRISLLLRLTGTVIEDIPGYPPDGTDLPPILEWLDMLDRGWLSVLCKQAWGPVRGESEELPQHLLEMTPAPTQTDCTRVHSLLITGISALEDWMENKSEDDDDNLVHDMRRLGHQGVFDEVFSRTLTKLRELGQDEGGDEEELLAHLPCWSTVEEGVDGDVSSIDRDEVEMNGDDDGMEETMYDHI